MLPEHAFPVSVRFAPAFKKSFVIVRVKVWVAETGTVEEGGVNVTVMGVAADTPSVAVPPTVDCGGGAGAQYLNAETYMYRGVPAVATPPKDEELVPQWFAIGKAGWVGTFVVVVRIMTSSR